jgi:hypothetical protein
MTNYKQTIKCVLAFVIICFIAIGNAMGNVDEPKRLHISNHVTSNPDPLSPPQTAPTTSSLVHFFTGLPITDNGWTDLLAMIQHPDRYKDSRIVYVSTSGNDSTGEIYSVGASIIGANPYIPAGDIKPYASFSAAYDQLRNGYPDILLLKRGEEWIQGYTALNKSGRSQTERFIIAAYGAKGDRPKIISTSTGIASATTGINNLIVADLLITPESRDPLIAGPTGVSWNRNSNHVLFEGNHIAGYRNNIAVQAGTGVAITNFALRRNVVVDAWNGTGHCNGIYVATVPGMLIEENIWDHNGWHPDYQLQNTHSRNMYLDYSPDLIVRGNISARSSSEGVQMRYGGLYEYNLDMQNSAAAVLGHNQTRYNFTGAIRHNVVLDARDINNSARGWGFIVGNRGQSVDVYDNILAHQKSGTGALAFFIEGSGKMAYQYQLMPDHCSNSILEPELGEEASVTSVMQCGGPCTPCTAFDGILNNEELAIDCGGPNAWPCTYTIDTTFRDNIVYKWHRNGVSGGDAIQIRGSAIGVTVKGNIFQQPLGGSTGVYYPGVHHQGPDKSWVFENNIYYGGSYTHPFRAGSDSALWTFAQWEAFIPEINSSYEQVVFTDPERTIETYAAMQGLSPTGYQDGLEKFLTEARQQSRFNWRDEYTAVYVINYIRAGFDRPSVTLNYVDP